MKLPVHDSEIILSIDDADLKEIIEPATYDKISVAVGETAMMGPDTSPDVLEAVRSALPRAIIRKLQKLFAAELNITEIELKFSAQGAPLGMGFAADVTVKVQPRQR